MDIVVSPVSRTPWFIMGSNGWQILFDGTPLLWWGSSMYHMEPPSSSLFLRGRNPSLSLEWQRYKWWISGLLYRGYYPSYAIWEWVPCPQINHGVWLHGGVDQEPTRDERSWVMSYTNEMGGRVYCRARSRTCLVATHMEPSITWSLASRLYLASLPYFGGLLFVHTFGQCLLITLWHWSV